MMLDVRKNIPRDKMEHNILIYVALAALFLMGGSLAVGEDLACQASGAAVSVDPSPGGIPYTIAFIAGAISVLTPCSLPLLLAYMAAIGKTRRSFVSGTLAFFAGLCVVWVLLGLFISGVGTALITNSTLLHSLAGLVMIVFGIVYILEIDLHLPKVARRAEVTTLGMFLFGLFFTLACAPCAGPILGGILMMALEESPSVGAFLMFLYALGFMLTAIVLFLLAEKGGKKLQVGKRVRILGKETGLTNLVGGLLLISIGTVYLLGGAGSLVEVWAPLSNATIQLEGAMMDNPSPFGIALIAISTALVLVYMKNHRAGNKKSKKELNKKSKKAL